MIVTKELDRKKYLGQKPPAYLTHLLTKVGGLNFYGDPHFRLVWALDRLAPSGGTWIDWPKGSRVEDRNQSKGHRPWRREAGVRMIPRYGPIVGWCLERWVPARAYGPRTQWYAPQIVGGTMILVNGGMERIPSQGEYPSRGDYEYCGFLFQNDQLSEATVVEAVQRLIRDREELPVDPIRRIHFRARVAAQAAEAAERIADQQDLDIIESFQPAFKGQIMSGAGVKRPHSSAEILKRLKIGSHHIS